MGVEVILAASFAVNVIGAFSSVWMLRKLSLLEGEVRGMRSVLDRLAPAAARLELVVQPPAPASPALPPAAGG